MELSNGNQPQFGMLIQDGDYLEIGGANYGPIRVARPVGIPTYALPMGALRTAIENGGTQDESWAWHKQMSDTLRAQSYTDDELYALEGLNDMAFQAVEKVVTLRATLTRLLFPEVEWDPPATKNGNPFDPGIWEQQTNPTDIYDLQRQLERERYARAGINVIPAQRMAPGVLNMGELAGQNIGNSVQNRILTSGNSNLTLNGNPGSQIGGYGGVGSFGSAASQFEPTEMPDAPYERTILRLFTELALAEVYLTDVLQYAFDRNCLTPNPGPCDWSPLRFAERLNNRFVTQREYKFSWCVEVTRTNDFQGVANVPADRFEVEVPPTGGYAGWHNYTFVDGAVCTGGAYNSTVSNFERYFECLEANRREWLEQTALYLAALGDSLDGAHVVVDAETGNVEIGQGVSSADKLGDRDLFAAEYSFEAAWNMPRLPDAAQGSGYNWCTITPSATASFSISGYALGEKFDLIKANADVGFDVSQPEPRIFVEVFGDELVHEGNAEHPNTYEGYSVVAEGSDSLNKTFFSASAIIMVGPVPVTLSAGLSGRLGASGALAAGSPQNNCQDGSQALSATFAPSAGIEAFASASLDALVIELGIKIILTLVDLSFPLTLRDPLIQSSQVIVVIHDFRFERSRSLHVPILEA